MFKICAHENLKIGKKISHFFILLAKNEIDEGPDEV